MRNIVIYYYNLNPTNIHQKDNMYYFKIDNERYFLYPLLRNDKELNSIYQINIELLNKKIPVHQIILNKQNNIITTVNDMQYVLFKSFVKKNDLINIYDILDLSNDTIIKKQDIVLDKSNWPLLWEAKNDYLEYQVSQFGIKYPVICETFSYYIGLAENAILYAKNTNIDLKPSYMDSLVISHRRITDKTTLFDLYNPLEFVIDFKVRDIAEYIKFKFFYNRETLWEEINIIFNKNQISDYSARMLFARLLYPTYYFDLYDEIIDREDVDERKLVEIVEKQEEYEEFLADIYHYISMKYPIPAVEWLIKRWEYSHLYFNNSTLSISGISLIRAISIPSNVWLSI